MIERRTRQNGDGTWSVRPSWTQDWAGAFETVEAAVGALTAVELKWSVTGLGAIYD
jgi:hypothetical protein